MSLYSLGGLFSKRGSHLEVFPLEMLCTGGLTFGKMLFSRLYSILVRLCCFKRLFLSVLSESDIISICFRKGKIDFKEYVASLIDLYKNNGAVLCAGIFFLLILSLYLARTRLLGDHRTHTDRDIAQILSQMWFTHGPI